MLFQVVVVLCILASLNVQLLVCVCVCFLNILCKIAVEFGLNDIG